MTAFRSTWPILLLFVGLSTYADENCQVALDTPTSFDLPAPLDAEARALDLSSRMLASLRRDPGAVGSNDAMALLTGVVRPYQDAVATYLQTSANHPGGLSRNGPTELASSLHDELADRLRGLSALRSAPLKLDWMTLRRKPAGGDFEAEVTRVRYLHFAVRYANERLDAELKKWPAVLAKTNRLRECLARVTDLLSRLRLDLSDQVDDYEFKLRLQRLSDDVRDQSQLLENVHVTIEQRVQFANALLDQIRTLLIVRLPLEAVMGDRQLDLSPLEPPEFAAATAPVSLAATQDSRELVAATNSIIKAAKGMSEYKTARDSLVRFVRANGRNLDVDTAIRLATCIWEADYTVNTVLTEYANLRANELSQSELIKIAASCRDDATKQAIINLIPVDRR